MRAPAHIALVAAAGLAAWVLSPERPSSAARSDFVGTDACGKCHPAALAAWKKSAHAHASETLGARVSDRRCLACHATGEAPAGRPYGSGVGCESCHGSGAGYAPEDVMRDSALAQQLGLRDLSTPKARAALCNSCHRTSTRLQPFELDAAWARIAH